MSGKTHFFISSSPWMLAKIDDCSDGEQPEITFHDTPLIGFTDKAGLFLNYNESKSAVIHHYDVFTVVHSKG